MQPSEQAPGQLAPSLDFINRRPSSEQAILLRAVEFAQNAHSSQKRASGEPYYHHAIAVASILNDLNLDYETLAAAILHDVLEDTAVGIEEITADFGGVIASLVDGVTKMERLGGLQAHDQADKHQSQAESLRKLLLAMAEDVRVVLIKLADRLHNMRTLKFLDAERQQRIAEETLEIYAPLANRLGIWQIKWELEDLSLRYLEPDTYHELVTRLDESRVDREKYIQKVVDMLARELDEAGIKAEITGRPKHINSIWRKMQQKHLDFEQVFDLRAVRILVQEEKDCYAALGIVHGLWRHISREFDDYIANPKENSYRSLHTAVVGPEGRALEVQIRTHEMDQHAELGVAAHWRYKEGGHFDQGFEDKIAWLRQLLEWKDEEHTASDFVDRFKTEAFEERIYALTPAAKIIDLPMGATPLDFAYAVHSEVGHRCRGARVNGKIVPLTYTLKNADQVEILTAREGAPSRDWLNPHSGYLQSSRAKSRVRTWFRHQDSEQNATDGRAILDREMHRLGIHNLSMEKLAEHLNFSRVDGLLVAIGRSEITTGQLANKLNRFIQHDQPQSVAPVLRKIQHDKNEPKGFNISGVGNLLTSTANCCHPVPNDPIVGFITRGRGVTIHRQDCSNVEHFREDELDRLIDVSWGKDSDDTWFTEIFVLAYDRPGLLSDVTSLLANEKINLQGVNTVSDKSDGMARMSLMLEISDIEQLSRVLTRIGQLSNVVEAHRKS